MSTRIARNLIVLIGAAGAGFLALSSIAVGQNVRTRDETSKIVSVEKVTVTDGSVSGEVVNRSRNPVRDVQLFVRHTWLWDNETKPGKDDPSNSDYYTLPGEIAPGGRRAFEFKPSLPLAKAPGGHFETSAAIAGFTEVFLPKR